MLNITRHQGQGVHIGGVVLTVGKVKGGKVELSFDGDRRVPILRSELTCKDITREEEALRVYNELNPGRHKSVFESIPKDERKRMLAIVDVYWDLIMRVSE